MLYLSLACSDTAEHSKILDALSNIAVHTSCNHEYTGKHYKDHKDQCYTVQTYHVTTATHPYNTKNSRIFRYNRIVPPMICHKFIYGLSYGPCITELNIVNRLHIFPIFFHNLFKRVHADKGTQGIIFLKHIFIFYNSTDHIFITSGRCH